MFDIDNETKEVKPWTADDLARRPATGEYAPFEASVHGLDESRRGIRHQMMSIVNEVNLPMEINLAHSHLLIFSGGRDYPGPKTSHRQDSHRSIPERNRLFRSYSSKRFAVILLRNTSNRTRHVDRRTKTIATASRCTSFWAKDRGFCITRFSPA